MEYYMKLPRNRAEFALFLIVLSLLSVNIIAPLITCFEAGFSLQSWSHAISVLPLLWPCVVAIVLLTYYPASWLTSRLTNQDDSFRAHVIINALCSVLMMSVLLTVIGSWIGCGAVTLEPIEQFFFKWPRNFAVAFGVEAVIAQPIARFVMLNFHKFRDSRAAVPEETGA